MNLFQLTGRVLAMVFVFSFGTVKLLGKVPSSRPAWLNQYAEHQEFDGVYVVKQIDVSCQTYRSFLVDKKGNKLTPALRDIGAFSNGLAEFVPFGLSPEGRAVHGFINKKGAIVVPPIYLGTDKFYQGKTWVIYSVGKQYGLSYIDTTGKATYRIPIEYFNNDFLIAKATVDFLCNHDCKEDIIWWKKNEIFLLNWNFSTYIEKEIKSSKGIYHFLYQGKYGIIDKNFILKIPVALDGIDPEYEFSGQGMERVKYGGKYGFVDVHTGEMVTPFIFDDTRKPTAGLFWVKRNKKWGCIDKTGKVKIPFLYDEATGFTSEDRSAVAIGGKFGHIDKTGKIRTPLKYQFASYFNNGISMVRIGDKYGYMDVNNRFITRVMYDHALPFDHKTTTADRFGLRYKLTLDGKETFLGFSDDWNALFILLGISMFVGINSYFFKKLQKNNRRKK